jgi:hypothetical protein
MPRTLVIQSHRTPLPSTWLHRCLQSVRNWAQTRRFDYRFIGDELFTLLPENLREKTLGQPVIAADLARLLALREGLREGFETAIWCDADFLIFAPDQLELPPERYALGREVWVQDSRGTPRAFVKVHNAFLMFRQPNPFLDFYVHAAERMIARHDGPMAPQFIGPKFLSAIHNIVGCPVVENAAALSPSVIGDLLRGSGPALTLFHERSTQKPAGVNLCASLAATGEVADSDVDATIDLLLGL